MNYLQIFARNLKLLRQEKGLTQTELAHALMLTRSRINGYENAINEPDFSILIQLADYFGVSIDFLIGRTERNLATLDFLTPNSASAEYTLSSISHILSSLDLESQEKFTRTLVPYARFLHQDLKGR